MHATRSTDELLSPAILFLFFVVVVVQFGLFLLSMHSKQLFVPYSIATFSVILVVVVGILAINRVRMWQKR